MKKLIFVAIVTVFMGSQLSAQSSGIGVGLRLGDPTGLGVKLMNQSEHSLNLAAAWGLGEEAAPVLQGDYVLYNYSLLNLEFGAGTMPLYYGLGAHVRLADNTGVGIRVPVGLDFKLNSMPLDILFELVPTLALAPSTDFEIHGGLGVHYFF